MHRERDDARRAYATLRRRSGCWRRIRSVHESGANLPTNFDSFRVVEEYRETAASRGGEIPDRLRRRPISGPARSRPLSPGRSTTRSPATTTCWPATSCAAPSGSGSSTGSTRAWGIATSTWRTSRSTTSSHEADDPELLADYFSEEASARRLATLRLMLFMSDFREAMWGVVQNVASELDFDFKGYAATHFERMRETARRPATSTGGSRRRWRSGVSSRTPPAA